MAGFTAKSQILLDADSTQIKKVIYLQGGRLNKSLLEKNFEIKGSYYKMSFLFPSPPEGNSGIIKMTFCLTLNNRCFKYYESYWGKDFINEKITAFNKPSYGLKRVNNSLHWINKNRKNEARIYPEITANSRITSVYILEIKNI